MIDQNESGILLPIPLGRDRVFRNQAMDDIVELLYRNSHEEFGVRQLREITDHGGQTVDTALKLLTQLRLIQTRRDGNKKLISINRERIQKPDDPILKIPQEQFQRPVKAFVERVKSQYEDNLVGILVFGSVARGEADRASDVDIQAIVENDLLPARRAIQDIRKEVDDERFDGDRYELQVLVESIETAEQYGDKLHEIFTEGITVYDSGQLQELRRQILNG